MAKRDKLNVLKEIKLITKWLILNEESLTEMEELKLCEALWEAYNLLHERHETHILENMDNRDRRQKVKSLDSRKR